jgi:NitT/TauT family transport system substrate-binding protein
MMRSLGDSRGTLRVAGLAIAWLALISCLHAYFNGESKPPNRVVMGYMPVVTNLAAPIVAAATKGKEVQFEAMKFASFAEMGEAFRSGHIQVAFVIAPLAITLYQQGVPLKIVYIGNRHESTMVVRTDIPGQNLSDLSGYTIAVPMRYSGHYLALKRYFRQMGQDQQAPRIVEIPPPDMPAALTSGGIDGYFVGEPFASKALQAGIARKFLYVEDIWPGFICNLMIVRDDLLRAHPEWVQALVSAAARAGFWARDHEDDAIRVAAEYWGQSPDAVRYTFEHPRGRFRFDRFQPIREELQEMADEMVKSGLLETHPDLTGLVEDRFARAVSPQAVATLEEVVR